MSTVIIIGAGNIGRGFIGQLFSDGGWDVCFADVVPDVIKALNERHEYPLEIVSSDGTLARMVKGVRAVDGRDTEAEARELADCDLAVTCVGAKALKFIMPNLAAGVKLRLKEGKKPLNLLICENLMDADIYIHSLLKEYLTDEELEAVGLVETSVGRMVPLPDRSNPDIDPMLVRAEGYSFLPCDRDAFRGEIPECPGLVPVSPFRFMIERKLYLHNMGHAVCAYLGMYKGYNTIAESIGDAEIRVIVREAMTETASALSVNYDKPLYDIMRHSEDLIRRFGNARLGDTCARVGNDVPRKLAAADRLTGAAKAVIKSGASPVYLSAGAAAALLAYGSTSPETFAELSGEKDGVYFDNTMLFAAMLSEGKPLSEIIAKADSLKAGLSEKIM